MDFSDHAPRPATTIPSPRRWQHPACSDLPANRRTPTHIPTLTSWLSLPVCFQSPLPHHTTANHTTSNHTPPHHARSHLDLSPHSTTPHHTPHHTPVHVAQHVLNVDVLLEQPGLGAGAQRQAQDLARSIKPLGTDLWTHTSQHNTAQRSTAHHVGIADKPSSGAADVAKSVFLAALMQACHCHIHRLDSTTAAAIHRPHTGLGEACVSSQPLQQCHNARPQIQPQASPPALQPAATAWQM